MVVSRINSQHAGFNVINDSRIDTQSPTAIDKHKQATTGKRGRKNSTEKQGSAARLAASPLVLLRTRPPYMAASTTAAARERSCSLCSSLSFPSHLTATAEQHIHTCTYKDARLLRTYTYIMYMYVCAHVHAPSDHLARGMGHHAAFSLADLKPQKRDTQCKSLEKRRRAPNPSP